MRVLLGKFISILAFLPLLTIIASPARSESNISLETSDSSRRDPDYNPTLPPNLSVERCSAKYWSYFYLWLVRDNFEWIDTASGVGVTDGLVDLNDLIAARIWANYIKDAALAAALSFIIDHYAYFTSFTEPDVGPAFITPFGLSQAMATYSPLLPVCSALYPNLFNWTWLPGKRNPGLVDTEIQDPVS